MLELGKVGVGAIIISRTKVQRGADRTQGINTDAEYHMRLGEWMAKLYRKKYGEIWLLKISESL